MSDLTHIFQSAQADHQAGRLAAAETAYRAVLTSAPYHTDAMFLLATLCLQQSRMTEAVQYFSQVVQRRADLIPACITIANTLQSCSDYEAAIALLRAIVAVAPGHAIAHNNLANAHTRRGELTLALTHYDAALHANPTHADVYANRATALARQGRIDEALVATRSALAINPHLTSAQDNLLMFQHYDEQSTAESLAEAHRNWGKNCTQNAIYRRFTNIPDPARRLRVGYVSADFREHSCAYYLAPLLQHHDASAVEIFCYDNTPAHDAMTTQLQSFGAQWRRIFDCDDAQVIDIITHDAIDILIDCSGHTEGNRLGVFAQKPAPLQCTYLGYPNTTGLSVIDYRLTDGIADPNGAEKFYTEAVARLPECFLCYAPNGTAPDVAVDPPCLKNNFVTLGSFNNLMKIGPQLVALWARILRAMPTVRLVLKNKSFSDADTVARYVAQFALLDIACDRLTLSGWEPGRDAHLRCYTTIDLALDTFPFNGATTTCEAAWMGVPTVTLCGDRHQSRVGASLLTPLGLTSCIAHAPDAYVAAVQRLAQNVPQLSHWRKKLREEMRSSALCNAPQFAKNLEATYRTMWQKWCVDCQREGEHP